MIYGVTAQVLLKQIANKDFIFILNVRWRTGLEGIGEVGTYVTHFYCYQKLLAV